MLQYRLDDAARRIVVHGRGDLSAVDVRAFVDWQILEGCWEYAVLYDMRDVARTLGSSDQAELVEYIAFVTKNLPPRGPLAVLTHDTTMVGVATEYGQIGLRAGLRVKTFSDESEALRWLDDQTAKPPLRFVGPSE